jgi:hypothetical protein
LDDSESTARTKIFLKFYESSNISCFDLLYISDLPTFPGNISDFDYEITFSARFVDAFNENARVMLF